MADPATAAPAFVSALVAHADTTLPILQYEHPDYAVRKKAWQVLLDGFEGAGGFLDGAYILEFPREDSTDLTSRRARARYHNYLESLVDLYTRFLFTQGVKRSSENEAFNAWTEDVDGANTSLTELLRKYLSVALVHGHAGCLVDKTPDAPMDQTQAGERGRVIASIFTALAIPDWRHQRNVLTSVKLLESAPEGGITDTIDTDAKQYLLWDTEGWARFDAKGELVGAGVPNLEMVPLVVLRPKPSYTSVMLGRPLVSNANLLIAMFNRASEEDNVLRDQAFSVLTVEVGENGNVQKAKEDIGGVIGSAKALIVQGTIDYKTPDQSVPATIRENLAYLVQEVYRAAHVRVQRTGGVAESGDSIRLQYTELNEALQGIARALSQAEKEIARAWFAWMFPTPDAAQAAFEAAKCEAQYPDEFFLDALIDDLEAWAEAVRMDLGDTMTKRIKKRAVQRIDPDIPKDELDTIFSEIDAQKNEPPPDLTPPDMGDPVGQGIAQADKQAVMGG